MSGVGVYQCQLLDTHILLPVSLLPVTWLTRLDQHTRRPCMFPTAPCKMKPAHSTLPLVWGPGDGGEVGKQVIGDGCRPLEVTAMYFVKLKSLPVNRKRAAQRQCNGSQRPNPSMNNRFNCGRLTNSANKRGYHRDPIWSCPPLHSSSYPASLTECAVSQAGRTD